MTFAGGDRFYATAASGGRTWLVAGSIAGRRLTALRTDAECPSLSPDGTRIVLKKRGDLPPGRWRLAGYGLPRGGAGVAGSDVWRVPADGTGAPLLLVPDAWSPAVVW